ncbi:MAG TPA: tRNA preQ1(34) S-adenosylmethionine ribosyltransferase-isomerase QueA [Vicinamibacterales bacterium]|nr:tRNA preQ1(34) S-adenosylmethionine ribosyltransferase-isomerase QueA [Vicinamibacterales bacterium]
MLVSDFDFDLPDTLIAQEAAPRGESRLLVLDRATGALTDAVIGDLPMFLRAGDLLVVNDSRVFAARLLGNRVPSGGAVECLLLSRSSVPPPDGDRAKGEVWTALMHPGQKLKPGALVRFTGDAGTLMVEVLERHFHGRRTIRLWTDSDRPLAELIDALGHVPLPPYISRPDTPADRERYQTVYARERGSVAAPTAGLHFTAALLDRLTAQGVEHVPVTLHVGYGTFKPVTVDRVEHHIVDPEPYTIDEDTAARIARARAERRRIIAVGTTTTRALEDAARRGAGTVRAGSAPADTFIYPGFDFQVINGLVTNFHLPRSSLLMLVCAFAGRDRVLDAYRTAIARGYRFYSYGDAMLIL